MFNIKYHHWSAFAYLFRSLRENMLYTNKFFLRKVSHRSVCLQDMHMQVTLWGLTQVTPLIVLYIVVTASRFPENISILFVNCILAASLLAVETTSFCFTRIHVGWWQWRHSAANFPTDHRLIGCSVVYWLFRGWWRIWQVECVSQNFSRGCLLDSPALPHGAARCKQGEGIWQGALKWSSSNQHES